MKYLQCNGKCKPEKNLHWLGDRFFIEGRKCCGCGGIGVPHIGFGYPCNASVSGSHYFDEKTAEINAGRREK